MGCCIIGIVNDDVLAMRLQEFLHMKYRMDKSFDPSIQFYNVVYEIIYILSRIQRVYATGA